MSDCKLLYTNLIRDTPATLTPSSEATDYDADNLFDNNYAVVWHSTAAGASAETIVADFGGAVSISACALGNTNIRSTATVKIQGHTADSWGTPDVDETITVTHLDGYTRSIFHDFNSASKRYWRLSITDNGNPDGYIEVGEWSLGVAVTLNDMYDSAHNKRIQRNNVTHQTEYNQVFVYQRDWGWQFDLSWTNATETTRDQLRALQYEVQGNAIPFFFVMDDTNPADVYYVRLDSPFEEMRVQYNVHTMRALFTEEMPGLIVPR